MLETTKILLTTPYDLNVPGGVNNQLWGLYRYLKTHTGARVLLVGPASDPDGIVSDPDVLIYGKVSRLNMNGAISNLTFDLSVRRRVRELMRTFAPHIVHFQELFAPVLNNYVLKYSRALNVATFHTAGENSIGYTLAWAYLRYQVKRIHLRIAVSDAAKRYVEKLFPGRYHIVPNAIDLSRAPHNGERVFPADRKNILFVGRTAEPRKGFEYLLRAYARLEAQYPGGYRLIVAGTGGDEWRGAVPVGDIRWLGPVSDEVRDAAYAGCDVFCAPSVGGESFGIVMLESFAHGKPAVGFRIGGYTELVGDRNAAVLVPNRDDRALADAIVRICSDARLYDEMSGTARCLAEQYAWTRIGKQIVSLYQSALVHRQTG